MSTLIGDLKFLTENPAEVNVVDNSAFHKRICSVFNEISQILQRSAGPCGAPTVISNMPSYHITKDGYTIAKNIMYDNYKGYLDQVITYMITDICERLNNVVGDGTTAAILCTNKMYQEFADKENAAQLAKTFFLPRDIIYRMQSLKTKIINELMASARNIKDLPKDEMVQAIRDVVYISSNGNQATTDMIADVYNRIGSPAIRVEKAKDGITKRVITEGFEIKAQLADKLYINTDEGFLTDDDVTVLMFDFKVGMEVFQDIIIPVSQELKVVKPGKRLLVMAPSYDTVALRNIAPALNTELAATGTITIVLTVYPNASTDARRTADDFAMLTNTNIITELKCNDMRERQRQLVAAKRASKKPYDAESHVATNLVKAAQKQSAAFILGLESDAEDMEDVWVAAGHVDRAKIGIESSVFAGFNYNKNRYAANVRDAEKNYTDACNQYRITGDFNLDIDDCLNRLNRLRLKTAVIYVGSDTEFSMQFDRDAMDDAVRAAQSAYFNGTVLGKHVSMIQAINRVRNEVMDNAKDFMLMNIFRDGFKAVNHVILENAFSNEQLSMADGCTNVSLEKGQIYLKGRDIIIDFPDKQAFGALMTGVDLTGQTKGSFDEEYPFDFSSTIFDFITDYEVETNTVLDLNTRDSNTLTFTDRVINSAATDREILTAAIDLVGLLLTSNQLIIARPNK